MARFASRTGGNNGTRGEPRPPSRGHRLCRLVLRHGGRLVQTRLVRSGPWRPIARVRPCRGRPVSTRLRERRDRDVRRRCVHLMAKAGAALSLMVPTRWAFQAIGHDLGARSSSMAVGCARTQNRGATR